MTLVRGLVVLGLLGLVLGACTRAETTSRVDRAPADADVPVETAPTTRVPESLEQVSPAPRVTDASMPAVTDTTIVPPDHPSLLWVDVHGEALAANALGAVVPQLGGLDATGRTVQLEPGPARAYVFVQPGEEASEALISDLVRYLDQFGLPGDGAIALTAVVTFWDRAPSQGDAVIRPGDWLVDRRWRGESLLDDPDSTAAAAFGVRQVPAVVLVDTEGRVVGRERALPSTRLVADALLMVAPPIQEAEPTAVPAAASGPFDVGDINFIGSSGDLYVSVHRRTVTVGGQERAGPTLNSEATMVAYDESPFGPAGETTVLYALSGSARALVPEVGYFRAECRRGEGGSPEWVALSPHQLRVLLEAGSFTGPASLTLNDRGDVVTIRMLLGC